MSELNVRFGGSATSKFIGEDYLDFEALESAGNVTFDEAARARFADAADRYMTNLAIEESDPGSREVQNKLKAMERHARELAKLLGDRRPQAVQAAQQEAFPFEQVDHKQFLSALSKIKVRAAKAHDHLTQAGNSGGRPRQLARHTLLVNIYELWKEAGGQGVGVYTPPLHKLSVDLRHNPHHVGACAIGAGGRQTSPPVRRSATA